MAVINESTRLNADIREAIINNALVSSGVIKAERAQIEARAQLLEDIVAAELIRIGKTQDSIRMVYNQLRSIDNDFLQVSVTTRSANPGGHTHITVNLCGRRVYMYPNGSSRGGVNTHLTEENTPHLRCASDGGNFYQYSVTVTDQKMAERFDVLEAAIEANRSARENVTATVGATLKKYKTIGKLIAAWPEVKDLLPKEYSTGSAVALSVDTLNAICGLPK